MKLWSYFKNKMLKYGNQFISDENHQLTYSKFITRSERFAKKLMGEQCCAILCNSELLAAMALMSCFIAKVTAVPLSFRYGEKHCQKILDFIEPTAMITDNNGELDVIRLSGNYKEPKSHPALIMCTSGTTGAPKGVMLSEKNILTNLKDIDSYFSLNTQDSILITRPMYHCAVLTGEFLVSLINGVKIVFSSQPFNPKSILEKLKLGRTTVFCGTPTLFSLLMKSSKSPIECSLKKLCVSGECLDVKTAALLLERFPDTEIFHVYGLTEACPRVSYLPPALFGEHPNSVGYPLPSVTLKIVASDGEQASPNEFGILWVHGDNVTEGYYNNLKQTKKVLRDGWLCTGDMAKIDENGLLFIKGRADEMMIRAGMNIYPQEIENVLQQDDRVNDVLVYGYTHPLLGVQIGLKIAGRFSNINEVKKLCVERLPEFQIPSKIEIVDQIQKNGSGKKVRKMKYD